MNLQGNAKIFLDDEENTTSAPAAKKPPEVVASASKVKQNLENAKRMDREVPYSISREAYCLFRSEFLNVPTTKKIRYAKKQSEMYRAKMAVVPGVAPGGGKALATGATVTKLKQPKEVEDEPDEAIQLQEEIKTKGDLVTDIKSSPDKEVASEQATERLEEGAAINRRVVKGGAKNTNESMDKATLPAAPAAALIANSGSTEAKINDPPTTKAPLEEDKNGTFFLGFLTFSYTNKK